MPTGELVIAGVRTSRTDKPDGGVPSFSYTPVLELYDRSGRYIKNVSFKVDSLHSKDKATTEADHSLPTDLSFTASGVGGVYVLIYSSKPKVMLVSSSGEVERSFSLRSVDTAYSPQSISIVDGQLLIEFAKSEDDTVDHRFILYDAQNGD